MAKRSLHLDQLRHESPEGIAAIFDISVSALDNWRKAGCPSSMRDGCLWLNAGEVAAWLKAHPNFGKGPGRPKLKKSADLDAAKLRKENALASKYEVELEQLMGRLIWLDDAKAAASEIASLVRNRFLQLPAAVAPQLVGLPAEDIEAIIEKRCYEILLLLSQSPVALGPVADDVPAPAEDVAESVGGAVSDSDTADC